MSIPPSDARFELKFVDYETSLPDIHRWVKFHPACFKIHHQIRSIHNIYYDTFDYYAFAQNLSGVSNREKLRYRWYGESMIPQPGRLELKKRCNLKGWKEILNVEVGPYNEGDSWRKITQKIVAQTSLRERMWLHIHPMPVLINTYNRQYYISENGKTRLTIDTKFRVWDQRFKAKPNFTHQSHVAQTVVVEVKCDHRDRNLASNVLQSLPSRVGRHSKYITGLKSFQTYLRG